MRRHLTNAEVKNTIVGQRRQNSDKASRRKAGRKYGPNESALLQDRRNGNSRKSVDEALASILLSQDDDLIRILQELDNIANALKSGASNTEMLRDVLHKTVLSAIRQAIMDRELRSLALSDDLTSLYNRRAFFALAAQQTKVTRRRGEEFLLFFVDVDNFKEINDRYGHGEGDRALIRVGDSLKRTFRNSDIVARLGGDEFAVLALEASCSDRGAILDRLETHLKESSAVEPRYRLSLSVGVARFDAKQSASLGDLLAQADRAMYEQKKAHLKQ